MVDEDGGVIIDRINNRPEEPCMYTHILQRSRRRVDAIPFFRDKKTVENNEK